jgi:hypothetical protein
MARRGGTGFDKLAAQLEELNKRIEKQNVTEFCRIVAKELAARLLAQVIRRTPVGDYGKAKKGGTLRRGWTAKTEEEAAAGSGRGDAVAYAQALPITKSGNVYEIEIINPVHYASYVEFGHRTRKSSTWGQGAKAAPATGEEVQALQEKPGGRGWVKGQFMLTISEKSVQKWADGNLQKKLEKYLEELLNG